MPQLQQQVGLSHRNVALAEKFVCLRVHTHHGSNDGNISGGTWDEELLVPPHDVDCGATSFSCLCRARRRRHGAAIEAKKLTMAVHVHDRDDHLQFVPYSILAEIGCVMHSGIIRPLYQAPPRLKVPPANVSPCCSLHPHHFRDDFLEARPMDIPTDHTKDVFVRRSFQPLFELPLPFVIKNSAALLKIVVAHWADLCLMFGWQAVEVEHDRTSPT
mmetsp:Transcript_49466/g.140135  ORF Transcript_49466/g.140135 Transcript_49466/m.140135 type:complete len:216 (-) Transcript_49466:786-1433(-)